MKILVDADACPVVRITEQVAKEKGIPVTLLCDTNHVLQSDYSEVITVGAGADAVDFKLVSICQKGDLVVTQDYGVAAMIPVSYTHLLPGAESQEMDPAGLPGTEKREMWMRRQQGMVKM